MEVQVEEGGGGWNFSKYLNIKLKCNNKKTSFYYLVKHPLFIKLK